MDISAYAGDSWTGNTHLLDIILLTRVAPLIFLCFQNNALFMRLDSFLERCHDILDLTQTIVQFSKLAKIEVGGTKGNTLTASVKQVCMVMSWTLGDSVVNFVMDNRPIGKSQV